MTSNNKYVVSGSEDKTIRIWNLLEKRQETVLQGHTSPVLTVAVTSDNKYIVSGSLDKTIRIWNLLEKRQETILNFDNPVQLVEVDIEYNLTIYFKGGKIKTININESI